MKLTNATIWAAQAPLVQLMDNKLPVLVGYKLAQTAKKLRSQLDVINDVRKSLVTKHGKEDPKTKKPVVKQDTPEMEAFSTEWAELLAQEVEIDITKVKLPETVAATCDQCHHNMDRPLEIEPSILLALDEFIEV